MSLPFSEGAVPIAGDTPTTSLQKINYLLGVDSDAVASAGNLSITSAATGTNWTAFASQTCKQLTIPNTTGTSLDVRRDGAGSAVTVPTGSYWTFRGLSNANALSLRRNDTSNSQATVVAEWEA